MAETKEPNFFIIGAAKAATTSLSSLLTMHPQAGMVRNKEPHFFSYDHFYKRGWDQYLRLFDHCIGAKAIGDASTSYSRIRYHPAVVQRIMDRLPNARIIYMVRNPVERMESAYCEHASTPGGQIFRSINDAVRQMPMIIDSSRYWEVFDAYRRAFGESRIKIVWFEEYIVNTMAVFQDVCRFLEIDDTQVPAVAQAWSNSRQEVTDRRARIGRGDVQLNMTWEEKVRRWVVDQIREDNFRFLEYFGRPKTYWSDLR